MWKDTRPAGCSFWAHENGGPLQVDRGTTTQNRCMNVQATRLVIIGDDDSEGDAHLDKAVGEQASNGNKLIVRART
jgi:hypothetical protein